MKKAFKLVGVAVTSLALLFASCSNDSISVETNATSNPDVVAIAYPGFNRIVWSPVTDGNTFSVIRDDGKSMRIDDSNVYDYDVEDGVEYTYTLYTASNASNRTETKVGNKTSVTLKAIKPEVAGENGQTHALALAYYEDGTYNADASKDFIVSPENIKVKSDDTQIFITFPAKTYLNYEVKLYKGNSVELLPKPLQEPVNAYKAAIDAEKFKTDYTAKYYAEITGAGEYRVQVTVKSYRYADDKIIAKETAKIQALEVADYAPTRNVKAVFTDTTNKKVRVTWSPAKNPNGELYPTTNYTVYAYDDTTKEVEKVTETIKDSKKGGDDIYYVDTEKVNEIYVVVLSDNGKYENIQKGYYNEDYGYWVDEFRNHSNKLVWYETPAVFGGNIDWLISSASFTSLDSDGKNNDFVIEFSNSLTEKQTLSVKYLTYDPEKTDYYSYSSNNFSEAFVSADYVKEGKVSHIKLEYGDEYEECVISDVPAGYRVAYQITVSEEGKKDYVRAYTPTYKSRD